MPYYNRILLLILLQPISMAASIPIAEKVTKEIHKEINVNPDATVKIENQFGNVNIITWDQNRVVMDIQITVEGRSLTKIKDRLDDINIEFDLSPNLVAAVTEVNDYWSMSWIRSSKVNYKINYTIKMPATNHLDLSNDYGVISLNYLEGGATISCDYGKLIIGELFAMNNKLSFDYTSNSSIEYIAGGEINADYSGFEITEAGFIDLNSDYTSSYFEIIDSLEYKNDFGKLKIENARSVKGKGDYLTFQLNEITEYLGLNNEFGSIRIAHVSPSTKAVIIESEYTGIQIGIAPKWPFLFEFDLEFAGLKANMDLEFEKQIISSNEKYYKGFYIKSDAKNKLTIDSEFGNLKLYPSPKN